MKKSKIDDLSCKGFNEFFRIVEASKLSLDDDILKYVPNTGNSNYDKIENEFKKSLIWVISNGIQDFRAQICDPVPLWNISTNSKGIMSFERIGISYKFPNKYQTDSTSYAIKGKYSGEWIIEAAKNVNPEKNTRLGTDIQRLAFLGVLMKALVEIQKLSIAEAYYAICIDSSYIATAKSYHVFGPSTPQLQPVCSCECCGWYDLGNLTKITICATNPKLFIAFGPRHDDDWALCNSISQKTSIPVINNATPWVVCDI